MPSVSLAETRGEAIGDAAADGHLTELLRAAPGPCGPPSQAQQNQNPAQGNQARHNKIKALCNKIQIHRNEIQIALPSMIRGFSIG